MLMGSLEILGPFFLSLRSEMEEEMEGSPDQKGGISRDLAQDSATSLYCDTPSDYASLITISLGDAVVFVHLDLRTCS